MIRRNGTPKPNDSFSTDVWVRNMFPDFQDPCPFNENWEVDGLELEWGPKVFINPPYSNVTPWIKRAIQHTNSATGNPEAFSNIVVMLLKHDSSTRWFRLIHECPWANVLMFQGRLKHGMPGCASFPSILVVFNRG
jgi:hypothetical protein